MEDKNWYIIHIFSGSEEFVVKAINEKIKRYNMEDQIGEIVIPKENVIEIKEGEKVVTEKRSFPGYILIKMHMSDKNWYFIRNTPKVTGFIGAGKKPKALSEKEVSTILNHMEDSKEKPKPKYKYTRGESVKIIDGPFVNFNAMVEEVIHDKDLLKVTVTIFGRPTPVKLNFFQVEKI